MTPTTGDDGAVKLAEAVESLDPRYVTIDGTSFLTGSQIKQVCQAVLTLTAQLQAAKAEAADVRKTIADYGGNQAAAIMEIVASNREISGLLSQITALREALKPFAKASAEFNAYFDESERREMNMETHLIGWHISAADLHRAAALTRTETTDAK